MLHVVNCIEQSILSKYLEGETNFLIVGLIDFKFVGTPSLIKLATFLLNSFAKLRS